MLIVADENIPFVRCAFESHGEVRTLPGRDMAPCHVAAADVLLVRSVTTVGPALLSGSSVRFVGTATAGLDHIDIPYLGDRGIGFASAPGSNAESVAQWVTSALLELSARSDRTLTGLTLGVVGVGNVGRRVVARARGLGMKVLQNDPPRARGEGAEGFVGLDEICAGSDVVTVHVPLTMEGLDPTHHLFSNREFSCLPRGVGFFNSSRGEVVDGDALLHQIRGGRLGFVALDVWEHEPGIDMELLEVVDLGSPHVAGYSVDAKVRGTSMLYRAFVDHFGGVAQWSAEQALAAPPGIRVARTAGVREVCRQVYDIVAEDAHIRNLLDEPAGQRAETFDRFRKEYPIRREFSKVVLDVAPDLPPDVVDTLLALGFQTTAPILPRPG